MVRQVVLARCGIIFDPDAFDAVNIPLSILDTSEPAESLVKISGPALSPLSYLEQVAKLDSVDAVQPLFDALSLHPIWTVLELIPFFVSWQDEDGVWHRNWRYVNSF